LRASLLRKALTGLFVCIVAPCVLLIRAIRPIWLIRFGSFDSRRMGHSTMEPELQLLLRQAGVCPPGSFDLFFWQEPVANRQLQRMWNRVADLHISKLAYYLDLGNRVIPGGEANRMPNVWDFWPVSARGPRGRIPRFSMRSPAHVSFTSEEEQRGRTALRDLGVDDGEPFICFNARDAGFLDTILPDTDWRYHDYRDGNIRHYLPAIDALTRRGCWGIRMGAFVKTPLETGNPRIVDYAMHGRTEFMDVFLTGRCRFLINDTSGLMSVAMSFRRPLVLVNVVPIAHFGPYDFEDRALFIPKTLRLRRDGRLLTFREILGSDIRTYFATDDYERAGIDVIENTPEDITAVALEMDDRIAGRWQPGADDDRLQERFNDILTECGLSDSGPCRIGSAFLREHRALLD
jgi:putative glycosyltransferase (TIGR04372 family)